ncbi:uncharacterized protein [Clytia hemisphaerica]|uniref:uncharacterized protein n=1 Tax=Clytia hemisphaerica TaxID=252671 RepID=UPI0034D51F9A|eukprot:TCONS_00009904-protein
MMGRISIIVFFCIIAVTIIEAKKSLTCDEYIAGNPMQVCVDGYIFERNDEVGVTWVEAEFDVCRKKGGHLASVTSDDQVVAMEMLLPTGEQAWLGTEVVMGTGPFNNDKTEVPMDVSAQITTAGNALVIGDGNGAITDLGELNPISTDVNHFFCKYNYFHNRKIYFGFPVTGMTQPDTATECEMLGEPKDGRIIQIDSGKLQNFVNAEVDRLVEKADPEEYLFWINMKYSETTMKYKWGVEGTYSPFRKWCTAQPDDEVIEADDRCVALTGSGCWKVYACSMASDTITATDTTINPFLTMCEFDIRESNPTNHELFTLIQVLRSNVNEITKDCKRCKGVE